MLAISAVLTFLGSPLGRAAAFMGGASLAVLIAGGVGYSKGDAHRAGIDAAQQAAFVQKQIAARDAADKANALLVADDEANATKTQEKTDDAIKGTSAATCLDGHDADQLRALWGKQPAGKPKPAVSPKRPSSVLR